MADTSSFDFNYEDLNAPRDLSLLGGTDFDATSDTSSSSEDDTTQTDPATVEVQDDKDTKSTTDTTAQDPAGTSSQDDSKDKEVDTATTEDKTEKSEKKNTDLIPAARLSKVTHERNELKAQLAALQAQVDAQKPVVIPEVTQLSENSSKFDLKAKQKAFIDAVQEGNGEAALQIQEEINDYKDEVQNKKLEERARALEIKRLNEQQELLANNTAFVVLQQYKFLDENHPTKNQEAIDEVRDFRIMYESKGFTTAQALLKAVERVVPLYNESTSDAPSTTATSGKRQQESVSKALETSSRIPPKTNSIGIGNKPDIGRINVEKMSQNDYEKLSMTERRKLLGG